MEDVSPQAPILSGTDSTPVFDEEGPIACKCGDQNVHFGGLVVAVAPDDDYMVDLFIFNPGFERDAERNSAANPSKQAGTKTTYRGGGFEVEFWCESGHAWVERFSFHKGQIIRGTRSYSEEEASLLSGYPTDSELILNEAHARAAYLDDVELSE